MVSGTRVDVKYNHVRTVPTNIPKFDNGHAQVGYTIIYEKDGYKGASDPRIYGPDMALYVPQFRSDQYQSVKSSALSIQVGTRMGRLDIKGTGHAHATGKAITVALVIVAMKVFPACREL